MKTIQSSEIHPAVLAGYGIKTPVHITAALARAIASTPTMTPDQRRDEVLRDIADVLAADLGQGVALMLHSNGGLRGSVGIRDRFGRGWLLATPDEPLPREWETDCVLPS
jgi:hypothetical protein